MQVLAGAELRGCDGSSRLETISLYILGKDSQKVPVPLVRVVLLSCVRQGCCPAWFLEDVTFGLEFLAWRMLHDYQIHGTNLSAFIGLYFSFMGLSPLRGLAFAVAGTEEH